MCGFVGIFHRDGATFEKYGMLHAMNQTIVHRGPDDAGIHLSGPVGLGFRRLSVIDVPGGHQPMLDGHTGVALVFNGEIYNYKQLRRQLEALGAQFQTRSDTEVLLRSFIHWGAQCVERLSGMFAFAAWDPRTATLTLARDRLGVKPLYWTQIGSDFVFASEVKAFFQHRGFERRADLDGISSYLSFRQPVWDNTYFEGVHKLLPGEMLVASPTQLQRHRYWSLPIPTAEHRRSEADWLQALSEKLDAAVRRCLVSDVPLGAYLSGGLDSNIMVALMARHMTSPPQTFSVGYGTHGYDEGAYAAEAAAAVGAEHTHLLIDRQEYIDGMAPLIAQCDAPLMIPQMVAGLKLSKEMRRHVKVALSGDGADELFGGYGRVMRSPFDWKKIAATRRVLGPAAQWLSKLGSDPYGPVSNLGCTRQIEHFFNVYHWMPLDEKMALFSPDVRIRLNGDRKTLAPFEDAFDQTRDCDPHDRVLHVFQKIHLGCVLDKVDTIGMLASLEGRVPFADHELVETFVHMPHRLKMKWRSPLALMRALGTSAFNASEVLDQNKYLLRKSAQRLLPPHLAQRKKMGFPTPLDDWLKAGMLDDAKAILLDQRCRERGLFDSRRLEHFLSHPQSLDHDFYGKKVWMLMNVELWYRGVVDAAPAAGAGSPPQAAPIAAAADSRSVPTQTHRPTRGADVSELQLRHEQWRIAGTRVNNAIDRLEVRFPYNGSLVGTVPLAQAHDVRSALAQAYAYRPTLTRHQRYTILSTARDLLMARTAAFVQSIVAESGLCVRDASYEVGRAAEVLRTAAHQVLIDDGDIYACDITQTGHPRRVYTQRDPLLGVIVAITPFNHPLNQVAHKIVPSIATNNRMLLKPSEKTPLTALLFADLLSDAGLPGPMLSVVTGRPEVIGEALLTSEQVDLVTFTGSVAAGKQIAARCVYKRQVLELGGNDPMIVMEDADLDEAVSLAVAGAYRNSGQRCTAIKRLLVHRQVADAFAERLVQATQRLKVGDPFDPQVDLGTVIDDAAAAQIERRVDAAAAAGAQVLCGHRRSGAQYLPTVVDRVAPTMELVRQETFGPVAPIIRIDSIDDAIRIANASDFGLSSAVCSNRWDYIQRCVAELQTGSVNIREVPGFRLESTPFGGIKSSGLGCKEGVLEAMRTYTNLKTYSLPWGERTVA